jgi:RNA 2',3'-cyclic 3'-phosphodiesterase
MDQEQFEPASGRLFVALELPPYVREAISRFQRAYRKAPGLSWTSPEKLHVTLAFLGEVDPRRQKELAARLPQVQVHPFFLGLAGLGVFPRKGRPQVLWVGVEKPDPRLFQLHGKVEQVLLDLGFEPERRRYSPHVTLARCQPSAQGAVAHILREEADFGTAPFQATGFALFSSQLTSEGAVYSKLLEVPFGGADTLEP